MSPQERGLKPYRVQGEGDYRIVEAHTFGEAVDIWIDFMVAEFEYDGSEEPESVELICTDPVLRRAEEKP